MTVSDAARARPAGWLAASGVRPRADGRRRGINADDVVVETKPAGRIAGGGELPVHQATGGVTYSLRQSDVLNFQTSRGRVAFVQL